ncbi:MAG: heme-binding protein [Microbacterium sp.]|uniref:heme-binding protein n=1 Tax=Microbacterium sp. TaxID=51671 RepID=UPI0039E59A4F
MYRTLDADGAQHLLDLATDLARQDALQQCFAAADASGHLRAFRRMDGVAAIAVGAVARASGVAA